MNEDNFKKAFVGAWRLVSCEAHFESGKVYMPYGKEPRGILIYDALDNVAVQIMKLKRQRLPRDDRRANISDTLKSAFLAYEAYFGKYAVDESEHAVYHRVEGSLFPNWTDGVQKRIFEFSEDLQTLTLKTASDAVDYVGTKMTAVLVWIRETTGAENE